MPQTRQAIHISKPIRQKKPAVPDVLPSWAGVEETAALLNLPSKFVRAEIKAGRCPHINSGTKFLVDVEGFNAALRAKAIQQMTAQAAKPVNQSEVRKDKQPATA